MSKDLINEVFRMKNLFGYERGRVISEQKKIMTEEFNYTTYSCIPQNWKKNIEDGKTYVQGEGNEQFQNAGFYHLLSDVKFFEDGTFKIGNKSGKYSCGANGTIMIDGVAVKKSTTQQTVQTLPNITVVSKLPKELAQKVGNKTGVQAFQDWLDEKHAGWVKKYKTLGGQANKGYGKYGPSTQAAWTQYKNDYLTEHPELNKGGNSNTQSVTSDSGSYKIDPTWLKQNGWIIAVEDGKANYSFKDDIVNGSVSSKDYQYIIYKDKLTYACQTGTKPSCYSNNDGKIVNKTEDIQSAKVNVGLDKAQSTQAVQNTTPPPVNNFIAGTKDNPNAFKPKEETPQDDADEF